MSDLTDKLRKNVPCGQVMGHGEYCAPGWECSACIVRIRAADEIERLEREVAYWRGRALPAEPILNVTHASGKN